MVSIQFDTKLATLHKSLTATALLSFPLQIHLYCMKDISNTSLLYERYIKYTYIVWKIYQIHLYCMKDISNTPILYEKYIKYTYIVWKIYYNKYYIKTLNTIKRKKVQCQIKFKKFANIN